ncbi:MAG: hypothetical protein ABW189_07270 [Rickettsiales bacterium]
MSSFGDQSSFPQDPLLKNGQHQSAMWNGPQTNPNTPFNGDSCLPNGSSQSYGQSTQVKENFPSASVNPYGPNLYLDNTGSPLHISNIVPSTMGPTSAPRQQPIANSKPTSGHIEQEVKFAVSDLYLALYQTATERTQSSLLKAFDVVSTMASQQQEDSSYFDCLEKEKTAYEQLIANIRTLHKLILEKLNVTFTENFSKVILHKYQSMQSNYTELIGNFKKIYLPEKEENREQGMLPESIAKRFNLPIFASLHRLQMGRIDEWNKYLREVTVMFEPCEGSRPNASNADGGRKRKRGLPTKTNNPVYDDDVSDGEKTAEGESDEDGSGDYGDDDSRSKRRK